MFVISATITLMLTVGGDLTDPKRNLQVSFPSKDLIPLSKPVKHCRQHFWELFFTSKSSKENPSLRVSGHVSSMNRTFMVEECVKDDF